MKRIIEITAKTWATNSINEFGITVKAYDTKETDKSYLFEDKRLSKDKIGKITDGKYLEGGAFFTCKSVYGLEEDEKALTEQLIKALEDEVVKKLESIQKQMEYLKREPQYNRYENGEKVPRKD